MKKAVIFLLIVVMVLAAVFVLSGCQERDENGLARLKTPTNLSLSGDALTWRAVKNAKLYVVYIGDSLETTTEVNSLVISVQDKGVYKVKVKALGDGEKYGDSNLSKEVEYTQNARLAVPTLTLVGNRLTWGEVDGAEKYQITVNNRANGTVGEVVTKVEREFVFEGDLFKEPDVYTASVVAIPKEGDPEFTNSVPSKKEFVVTSVLASPKITNVTSTKISWNDVPGAKKYKLKVTATFGDKKVIETTETTVSQFNVSDIELKESGKYDIQVMALGDGKVYLNSEYSAIDAEQYLYQMNEFDETKVKLEYRQKTPGDGLFYYFLTWDIMFEDYKLDEFNVTRIFMSTLDKDGKGSLSSVDFVINKNPADTDRGTVVDILDELNPSEKIGLRYSYAIDKEFITEIITSEGIDNEYKHDADYYGKVWNISIQVGHNDARYVSAKSLKIADTYLSYKIPFIDKGTNTAKISEVGHFAYFLLHGNEKVNGQFLNYTIDKDLDFQNYKLPMMPQFGDDTAEGRQVILDGGNKVLKNLVLDGGIEKFDSFGLVGANYATIRNLYISNAYIDAKNSQVVGLVAKNFGTIDNCLIDGKVNGANAVVGGLVGYNTGEISKCQSNATVSGAVAGGLVGANISIATTNTINVTEKDADGNVIINETKTKDSTNVNGIEINGTRAIITGSNANGNVEAKYEIVKDLEDANKVNPLIFDDGNVDKSVRIIAGGLVAYNRGYFTDDTTPYEEEAVDVPLTGSLRYVQDSIRYSSSIGNVTAVCTLNATSDYFVCAAGVVGYNMTRVSNSYSGKVYTNDITSLRYVKADGGKTIAGGFAGVNGGDIRDCYTSMNSKGAESAAGFVVKNLSSGTIRNSFVLSRSDIGINTFKGFVFTNENQSAEEGKKAFENCCFRVGFELSSDEQPSGISKIARNDSNYMKAILDIVNENKSFGTLSEKVAVLLANMTYLETFKATTTQNKDPEITAYGFIVDENGVVIPQEYKNTNQGIAIGEKGEKVMNFTGITAFNEIKVILTVK